MRNIGDKPAIVLETKEDLIAAIAQPETLGFDPLCQRGGNDRTIWNVRSNYLVDLIREIEIVEYPYNVTVQRLAEQRLEIEQQSDSGCVLSILVYNAQGFASTDKLAEQGFVALTQELVAAAFAQNKHIQTDCIARLTIRKIEGTLYLMRPFSRKNYIPILGQPARIIDRPTEDQ